MEAIYNSIKENIRQHPKIASSILGNVDLWKRSHYVILSEIIKDELAVSEALKGDRKFELGNTISHITLQRFFESEYQDKTHNDLRFLKTLDKICIFLGYSDLNSYISSFKNTPEKSANGAQDFTAEIIHNYCRAEFECLKKMPEIDFSLLLQYVFENSPLYHRITTFIKEHRDKNLKLITENNRSNFEIFDVTVVEDEENSKALKTQEFWNLFFENSEGKIDYFVNRLNQQMYFIKKIDGVWKIWDNYNPNAGEMNYNAEE